MNNQSGGRSAKVWCPPLIFRSADGHWRACDRFCKVFAALMPDFLTPPLPAPKAISMVQCVFVPSLVIDFIITLRPAEALKILCVFCPFCGSTAPPRFPSRVQKPRVNREIRGPVINPPLQTGLGHGNEGEKTTDGTDATDEDGERRNVVHRSPARRV